MVFVNAQKYACESCIKGHRSSACHHVDRPLFLVRRKGRPVSQCADCRNARKASKFHGRCSCDAHPENNIQKTTLGRASTSQLIPAFPNGIRDLLESMDPTPSKKANPKQKINTLLNPCTCKDVYNCSCKPAKTLPPVESTCCCGPSARPTTSPTSSNPSRGPSLAPILSSSSNSIQGHVNTGDDSGANEITQVFRAAEASRQPSLTIPNLETISSIAGSGCTCGVTCECPGCAEHNVPPSSSTVAQGIHKAECCGGCVDHIGTIEHTGSDSDKLNRFFRMAAALPTPPPKAPASEHPWLSAPTTSGSTSVDAPSLNPFDVRVFPPALFRQQHPNQEQFSAYFGLVQIPRLQCCQGQCICPPGRCLCAEGCNGNSCARERSATGSGGRGCCSPLQS